jgi:hypothetical protein
MVISDRADKADGEYSSASIQGFIDSNLAYKPQFIYNDYKIGKKFYQQ